MNFQLSIDPEHMALLKSESVRMNIPMSSYVKIKVFENLKLNESEAVHPDKERTAPNPVICSN